MVRIVVLPWGHAWVRAVSALHQLTAHTGPVLAATYSPDGTHILTGDGGGTARIWDATTGQPVGFTLVNLPDGETAVFDALSAELAGASDGAWRWLGWNVIQDGRITRLPAETYGALPPLQPAHGGFVTSASDVRQ